MSTIFKIAIDKRNITNFKTVYKYQSDENENKRYILMPFGDVLNSSTSSVRNAPHIGHLYVSGCSSMANVYNSI